MKQTASPKLARALFMYAVVSLFLFFEMALQVSPSVMSFSLMHDLNLSAFGLGLMSGCYFYTYTFMQIPSGLLFDRFNPRWVIVISLLACVLGSLLLGVAHHFYMACLARMLMGVGSAFAFVSVLVVTADLFKAKYFATMTGITQMLAALGAVSGQLPIHALVDHLGWRHTMFVFAIIGLFIALGVYFYLRYDRKKINTTEEQHQNLPLLQALKIIITRKQTWTIAAYACLLWAPMSGIASLWGVPYLVNVYHLSTGIAAFLCSLMWLGLAGMSPLLGYLSTLLGNRKWPLVFAAGLGTLSFAMILLLHVKTIFLPLLFVLTGAACAGQALSFTAVKENNPKQVVATAIAFNNMAVVISGALFQPLIGWFIHAQFLGSGNHYSGALSLVLIAYALAFIIALFGICNPATCKRESELSLLEDLVKEE